MTTNEGRDIVKLVVAVTAIVLGLHIPHLSHHCGVQQGADTIRAKRFVLIDKAGAAIAELGVSTVAETGEEIGLTICGNETAYARLVVIRGAQRSEASTTSLLELNVEGEGGGEKLQSSTAVLIAQRDGAGMNANWSDQYNSAISAGRDGAGVVLSEAAAISVREGDENESPDNQSDLRLDVSKGSSSIAGRSKPPGRGFTFP